MTSAALLLLRRSSSSSTVTTTRCWRVAAAAAPARFSTASSTETRGLPVSALTKNVAVSSVVRTFSAVPAAAELPPTLGVGKYKTSTGLVGLAVEPDWYNVMLTKFQALLDKLEASDMPETAQYRIDVTKWCNYVIASVKANPDSPEAVEDAVQMGQVEELIEMADDEMICMDVYLETRMWELVAASNPYIDFNPDPMRDPFGADGTAAEQEALRKGMEQK